MIGLLAGAAYHLFYLLGAVSIGFILLRLGYPEVRALPQGEKLFNSLLAGGALYAVAFVVDALFGYALLPPNGFIPLTCFALCAVGFVSFKFYSSFSRPPVFSVAVPTPEFASNPRNVRKMKEIKQRVFTPVPSSTKQEKKGMFSGFKSFFDSKKSVARGALAPAPKRELSESEQAEYFAKEIVPKGEMAPAPRKKGGRSGGGRRRLYLRRGGGDSEEMKAFLDAVQKQFKKGGKKQGKKKKDGGDDDFNFLVKDVYSELKQKPEKKGLSAGVPPEQPSQKGGSASSEVTMSDLFGTPSQSPAQAPKAEPGGNDLFSELSSISGGGGDEKKKGEKAGSEFVDVKREDGMACPNCGAKNTKVVYCPYCGLGFCANCATSLVPGKDAFIYTCPKCGEDVKVKKS